MMFPGCFQFGKSCKKPVLPVPETFENYQEAEPQADIIEWWKFFNDPILQNLIEQAVANNYDLRIAIEKIEEVRCIFCIRQADLLPIVSGFGFTFRAGLPKDIPLFANLTPNPTNILGLGINASWEIDIFGRLRSERNAAFADLRAQIEIMRDVYIMLVAQVAQLYVQARALEKKIKINEQGLDIDRKISTLLRVLFNAGLLDKTPINAQDQLIEDSSNRLILFQRMLQQTYHGLAVLLGQMPECFTLEPGNGQVPMAHNTLRPGLPSQLLRRRPDIRQAEQRLIASNERIREAIADYFPRFSLIGVVGSFSSLYSTWFDGNSLLWLVGPAFSWPLITFGRITYNVKAKKSIHRQALSAYCETVIRAFADVENALVNYFTQEEQLANVEKKYHSAAEGSHLLRDRFTAGLADQNQYMFTERNQLEVLLQVTDAQQGLSSALISVYKSLGGGWEYAPDCA